MNALPKVDEIYESRYYPEMRVIIQRVGTFRAEDDTVFVFNTLQKEILVYNIVFFHKHYKKVG
ncbi:MAG: hypothetical protein WC677_07595 [Clostridia bacterium]|jgi:hypothetical protein